MPGLRGLSDFFEEPPRHPSPKNQFGCGTDIAAVVGDCSNHLTRSRTVSFRSYTTPVGFFYKHNHSPIPVVERYYVTIRGLIDTPLELFVTDVQKLLKYNAMATLQCAGNRRMAVGKVRTVKGVGQDISARGNAVWRFAKLANVLELVGIPKVTNAANLGGKDVEFVNIDKCKNGGPYKAAIPLRQATNSEADVLLGMGMMKMPHSKGDNGVKMIRGKSLALLAWCCTCFNRWRMSSGKAVICKTCSMTLNRDHRYPLRAVVPSVIDARSVKWLDSINFIAEDCQGFFMQKYYEMFPLSLNWENINWFTRRPQMDFPVHITRLISFLNRKICCAT